MCNLNDMLHYTDNFPYLNHSVFDYIHRITYHPVGKDKTKENSLSDYNGVCGRYIYLNLEWGLNRFWKKHASPGLLLTSLSILIVGAYSQPRIHA